MAGFRRLRARGRLGLRWLARRARRLAAGAAPLAEPLRYRRHELVVVGLFAASLLVGLGIETWRARAPALFAWLEAERPGLGDARRAESPSHSAGRRPLPPRPTREAPLDLNRASAADLRGLPGIGPRLAQRIVAYRNARGGRFASTEDLTGVPGLGPKRLAAVRALVTVGPPGPRTADRNDEPS